jgi:porin
LHPPFRTRGGAKLAARIPFFSTAALSLALASTANAQSGAGQPENHADQRKPAKPKAEAPKPSHLFGDWAKPLSDKGVDLTVSYEGDVGAAISGGRDTGIDYAQQALLNANFDWGKIAGVQGLSSTVTLINRSGRSVAHRHIGDHLTQVETVYGGTDHAPVHLVQAFVDWKSREKTFDIAAGRLPVGNDFATSPYYCEYMNTSLCGYPSSLPAKRGFTAFPNSTWGARLRVAPSSKWYLQGGVYQVRPKLGGRWGFDWGWSGTTGAYIPIEAGWEPSFGPDELNGHYKIGFATDTSRYKDKLYDSAGTPFPISGDPPAMHGGRHSYYVLADQMLHRNGDGPESGLVALGGFVVSDAATSTISRSAFAGLRDEGMLSSRPHDVAGIGASYIKVSDRLAEQQRLIGQPVQSSEWVLEGLYKIAITDGLWVTPDVQYLIHPNAQRSIPNALAVAARLQITF